MCTVQQEFDEFGAGPRVWDGFLTEAVPPLAQRELEHFTNKRIFITGAGGFLGSALAQALSLLPIAHLVLLDHSEYGLYRLNQRLESLPQRPPASLVVGSILDRGLLREIMQQHAPDLVFHAAALKHVPLMETNPFAAAETNILGTQAVLEAVASSDILRLVFLSTDKAVEPISVMGASKCFAEQLVLGAGASAHEKFAILRLCNVLGSAGSVAALFARQAAASLPLTLTHSEATRFFLSTRDAVRCLLRSAVTPSEGGLFVPRLRQAHKILDLAQFLLARYGASTECIVETGLRRGDKLHERLISAEERVHSSQDPFLLAVTSSLRAVELGTALNAIGGAIRSRDLGKLARSFYSVVPSTHSYLSQARSPGEAIA